jgi:hypothetical protein
MLANLGQTAVHTLTRSTTPRVRGGGYSLRAEAEESDVATLVRDGRRLKLGRTRIGWTQPRRKEDIVASDAAGPGRVKQELARVRLVKEKLRLEVGRVRLVEE